MCSPTHYLYEDETTVYFLLLVDKCMLKMSFIWHDSLLINQSSSLNIQRNVLQIFILLCLSFSQSSWTIEFWGKCANHHPVWSEMLFILIILNSCDSSFCANAFVLSLYTGSLKSVYFFVYLYDNVFLFLSWNYSYL